MSLAYGISGNIHPDQASDSFAFQAGKKNAVIAAKIKMSRTALRYVVPRKAVTIIAVRVIG